MCAKLRDLNMYRRRYPNGFKLRHSVHTSWLRRKHAHTVRGFKHEASTPCAHLSTRASG